MILYRAAPFVFSPASNSKFLASEIIFSNMFSNTNFLGENGCPKLNDDKKNQNDILVLIQ